MHLKKKFTVLKDCETHIEHFTLDCRVSFIFHALVACSTVK